MRLLYTLLIATFLFITNRSQAQVEAFEPEIFGEYLSVRDLAIGDNEMYFTVQSLTNELSAIAMSTKIGNTWSEVELLPFSGQYEDLEPFLSPSGKRLYFASNRPVNPDSIKAKDFDIWYVERENESQKWSHAMRLDTSINSSYNEFYPAVGLSGSIYFTSDKPGSLGKDDIYMSSWNGRNFESPINLGASINSDGYEFNAYISPDESTLIYTAYNRKDGYGSGDLYISYKNEKNEWSVAKNMGEKINSNRMDYCPYYDFKRSTLYFTSKRSSFKNDRSTKRNLEQFIQEVNKYNNGLSRIFKINVDI